MIITYACRYANLHGHVLYRNAICRTIICACRYATPHAWYIKMLSTLHVLHIYKKTSTGLLPMHADEQPCNIKKCNRNLHNYNAVMHIIENIYNSTLVACTYATQHVCFTITYSWRCVKEKNIYRAIMDATVICKNAQSCMAIIHIYKTQTHRETQI